MLSAETILLTIGLKTSDDLRIFPFAAGLALTFPLALVVVATILHLKLFRLNYGNFSIYRTILAPKTQAVLMRTMQKIFEFIILTQFQGLAG